MHLYERFVDKIFKAVLKLIILAIVLLLAQAMSNLYLPSLNADIINNGVAKSDIRYIIKTGSFMLVVTLLLAACTIASSYLSSKIYEFWARYEKSHILQSRNFPRLTSINSARHR